MAGSLGLATARPDLLAATLVSAAAFGAAYMTLTGFYLVQGVRIMAERFKITKRVGELKAELGLPAADPGRETDQIARLRALAVESDLDPEFAEKLLNFIVDEVVRHHLQIAEERL